MKIEDAAIKMIEMCLESVDDIGVLLHINHLLMLKSIEINKPKKRKQKIIIKNED